MRLWVPNLLYKLANFNELEEVLKDTFWRCLKYLIFLIKMLSEGYLFWILISADNFLLHVGISKQSVASEGNAMQQILVGH